VAVGPGVEGLGGRRLHVSSMQRHLATRPGWLEWAWAALRPVFADGAAQTTACRLVGALGAPPLPPLSAAALRVLGVDGDGARAIRAACESFVRVSPTNLVFSGLLRRLLADERPAGAGGGGPAWTPPPDPGALPPLVDPARLPAEQRAVLLELGTEVDGRPFVPGLYRMLANWPAYLAHVATVLRPRFTDPATLACCRAVLDRIDGAVPALLARLPALPADPPAPPREQYPSVLAALDRYRETSPQMVVFGTLIRDALPPAA
jgi:hypothetical protein